MKAIYTIQEDSDVEVGSFTQTALSNVLESPHLAKSCTESDSFRECGINDYLNKES
jgi:hypothetical protein